MERGKTNCPLPDHEDTTPSCMIYGEKWWCFGCNRGGDVIDLVAHTHFGGRLDVAIEYLRKVLKLEAQAVRLPMVAPSSAALFRQASDQANFEVVAKLRADFPVPIETSWSWASAWDWLMTRYFAPYDGLEEAVLNGLPIDRAMDYLLAWRLWGLGRQLDNRNRKLVNELRKGRIDEQTEAARDAGGNRSRAYRARAWLASGAGPVNVD